MAVLYTNNAVSTLSASITNTATSFSVAAGQGALFPTLSGADYFYATLIDTSSNIEIIKVTARSTDTFTVVRGQDGTTARAFSSGDRIELRVVRAMLDDFKTDTRILVDSTDSTKKATFNLSGITTGTTRSFTLPDIDATIAVTSGVTQTYTNVVNFANANVNFGTSTGAGTINVASGATISGATKTVNIGTSGVSGSTTSINVGSANGTTTTVNGTLVFGGTAQRIQADFSNATIANRLAFQTSTPNTSTALGVLPNGTSSQAGINFFNSSDPTNASTLNLLANATEASIRAGITGSGSYLPVTVYTSGTLRFTVGTAGQWGIGATPDYGTAGYFFKSGGASGAPTWSALTSTDVTTALGGTPPKVTLSETAPSTPTAGDLWWNSGTGVMSIYFNDGDTSQWIDISNGSVSSTSGGVSAGKAIAMSMVFGF